MEVMENNYFTIMPMARRMEGLEPGKSYTGSVTVVNPAVATEELHYKVEVVPYSVQENGYDADFATELGRTQLAKWITVEESKGTLAPNKTAEVNFTVNVPENVPAGGQYAAIVVRKDSDVTQDEAQGMMVKSVYEMASLIYAEVAGETVHAGEVLENEIPMFVTGAPITLRALITNEGNTHEQLAIITKATDVFTGRVILEGDKARTELIMPESKRYLEEEVRDDLPVLGMVHVEQKLYYNGQSYDAVRDVIICPVWFIGLVVFVIVMLVSLVVHLIRKRVKKRKKKEEKE